MEQALEEISVEDRKRKLENCETDLVTAKGRIDKVNKDLQATESKLQKAIKSVSDIINVVKMCKKLN